MDPSPPPADAAFCALHPSARAEQACSRCGNFACRACLRSTPEGLPLCVTCDTREGATLLPWDQRDRLGTITAFARTCWSILWHPGRVLERASPEGSAGSSLWFAVLAQVTTWLTTGLLYSAVGVAFLGVYLFGAKPGERTISPATSVGITVAFILMMVFMVVVMGLGTTLLLSALDHLVLRAIGARPRPYHVTLRAHALSMAPCLLGLVPICGLNVAPVWAIAIRVFAYRGLHRLSTGKAVAGALVVPGLLAAVVGVSYVALFFLGMVAAARGNP